MPESVPESVPASAPPSLRFRRPVACLVSVLGGAAVLPVAAGPAQAASFPTVRMVVGTPLVDSAGRTWRAETGAIGGRVAATNQPIAGTSHDALYSRERYGMSGWTVPVGPGGTYRVTLRGAEIYFAAAGKRVFDVTAEGRSVASGVDVFVRAGGKNRAYNLAFDVPVTDGTLNLGFVHRVNFAKIGSISVSLLPPASTGSSWGAPGLVDPLVWVPSASSRVFKAPADRDVLVRWPSEPLDVAGGFQIAGGRNVVSRGGVVAFSRRYPVPGEEHKSRNRCFHISGNDVGRGPRTVHVEGLRCAGRYVWEGINVDSKGERGSLTVQLRDIRIDQVNVTLPGGTGRHEGGDAFQTWNGPHRLRIDGFTAKNLSYQGFFLQPYTFGSGAVGQWEFDRINLEGSDAGHGYLWWLAASRTPGSSGYVPLRLRGVNVAPGARDTRTTTLWKPEVWPDLKTSSPSRDLVR